MEEFVIMIFCVLHFSLKLNDQVRINFKNERLKIFLGNKVLEVKSGLKNYEKNFLVFLHFRDRFFFLDFLNSSDDVLDSEKFCGIRGRLVQKN